MSKVFAIVLGAAVWPGGLASPTLKRRAETAARLYRNGEVAGLIVTGGTGRFPPSEAVLMREIALGLGVPPEAIVMEEHARTTRENLRFAMALLPPGSRAVIVTDAWHLPRARLIARRLGLAARGKSCGRAGATWPGTVKATSREAAAFAWELLRPLR